MNIRYFEKRGAIWLDFKGPDGKRRRLPSGESTQAAAERVAVVVIARALGAPTASINPVTATVPAADKTPTMEEAYKLAELSRESWMRSNDKATRRQTFENLGLDTEKVHMSYFTRDNVRALRAGWAKEQGKRKGTLLSPSTINGRLSMLSVLLEACDLPPHQVKHMSVKGNERTRRVTDKEVRAMQSWLFSAKAWGKPKVGAISMADLITCGLELGCRESELLNLKWADVTEVSVTFRQTKNGRDRTLTLTPVAKRVLEARRLLPAPFSDLDQDRVTCLWAEARAAIGLADDAQFVFHSLRHENISRLSDAGVNTLTIQAMAGHDDINTTARYTHASQESMRAAQARVRDASDSGTVVAPLGTNESPTDLAPTVAPLGTTSKRGTTKADAASGVSLH